MNGICIVTMPIQQTPSGYYTLITNTLKILEPSTDSLALITFDYPVHSNLNLKIQPIILSYTNRTSIMLKVLSYILCQLKISYALIRYNKKIGKNIFFLTGTPLLPIMTTKILGKKSILTALASDSGNIKLTYRKNTGFVFFHIISLLETFSRYLCDIIILESVNIIKTLDLRKYHNKIFPDGAMFIDINNFESVKRISERKNLVGYFGRLSDEKGIINFAISIQRISKMRNDIEFIIGGDGPLREEVELIIKNKDKILAGKIPHEKIPNYLNDLKLLVLPSYTEGLPNIVLEAMACGTPVLATPVGAIPDIIKDCETGFIMENNSPDCIAKNVIRALEYPYIEKIVRNAHAIVEKKYTYEKAVERYSYVLNNI